MNNTLGKFYKVTTFGESHGRAIGLVIDGCPSGFYIDKKYIKKQIDRRSTGSSKFVTQRKEKDKIKILSGVYKKRTTGTPIGIIVYNNNALSKDYFNIKNCFRPGHADITYFFKYKIRDYRGGGRSSARTTLAIVIAGSIAKKILKDFYNIKIFCYLSNINNYYINFKVFKKNNIKNFYCPNKIHTKKIKNIIINTMKECDSIGCKLTVNVTGIMPGIGDPLFDKLDSNLSKNLMDLNAVKAIEVGKGFKSSKIRGSLNNDSYYKEGILKNDSGGFLGGISNGNDIKINVYFKPTSSLFKEQKTVNNNFEEEKINIYGRHDPCVGIRAVPIIESIVSITIIDSILNYKSFLFF
ncbi:chorismate synthase [Candidatus Vidania fulgoroideorum]